MGTELLIQSLRQECERLRKENNYLKEQLSLLVNHQRLTQSASVESAIVTKHSSLESKIKLFRSLFQGREDVYAIRWEAKSGKSGYTPACAHEWKQPICLKPAIKCSDCQNRKLLPLTNKVIIDHLNGKHVVGIYPMNKDETCSFLVVDFDKKNWQQMLQRSFRCAKV